MKDRLLPGIEWFKKKDWVAYPFQLTCWNHYFEGKSGILNAPTGSGKTYALLTPMLLEYDDSASHSQGVQAIWLSPIRALTKEIKLAADRAAEELGVNWNSSIRSGDTSQDNRKKQLANPPQLLITTPESLHVLFTQHKYVDFFKNVKSVVVDEWHELVGSKRGVQVELAMSRLKAIVPNLKIWGISATIANLDEAKSVLLGTKDKSSIIVKAGVEKKIIIESLIPEEIEKYPWAGHLGIQLLDRVIDIISQSKSTLIFTNTRSQCEIWYQKILGKNENLAGLIAMHHGSINREIRDWVEDALHNEKLKAVVCTSSLDLGVDFRPVESIIQIGSPKGVSRFVQRAGRSGHSPGAVSRIYFLPTHTLELVEGAALRSAIDEGVQEPRLPYIRSWDVLVQYLVTLSISAGFDPKQIFQEVKQTFSYASMTTEEWLWILEFIKHGGSSLQAYDEYQKIGVDSSGIYRIMDKRMALRHKMGIGTIVSDASMNIQYANGKKIGTIEEWFISQLNVGDVFWFAGRSLQLLRVRGMNVQVKATNRKTGKVPSWQGGRMPLSTMLAKLMRRKMYHFAEGIIEDAEIESLSGLFEEQRSISWLPKDDEFLIEYFETEEGFHLLIYPFEGRFVHEGMSAVLAQRISMIQPISFSIAMNDYGLELLSEKEIDLEKVVTKDLFSTKDLVQDIYASMNSVEMARRRFRDVARIAGLIFKGYPGQLKKERHLQSSSSLLFDVFEEYDKNNLLYRQAFEEVLIFQLEEIRLRAALDRIKSQKLIISQPERYTPFSFPIIVDRLNRNKLTSESFLERVKNMTNK